MTIEFWWRQIFEILMIHKLSLESLDVPQKIWARSVQPFWRLLDTNKQTDRQTDKQTDKPNLYIEYGLGAKSGCFVTQRSELIFTFFMSSNRPFLFQKKLWQTLFWKKTSSYFPPLSFVLIIFFFFIFILLSFKCEVLEVLFTVNLLSSLKLNIFLLGFFVSSKPVEIKVQMHLLEFILKLRSITWSLIRTSWVLPGQERIPLHQKEHIEENNMKTIKENLKKFEEQVLNKPP